MLKSLVSSVFVLLLLAIPLADDARAVEGARELPSVEDSSVPPEILRASDLWRQDCPRIGSVCLFGWRGGTVAGVDVNPVVGIVTTLARGTQLASIAAEPALVDPENWYVELIARFKTRSTREPITVAVMDYADPDGMARKEATAVWQIASPPVKDMGMRFVLSAEDGFLPRHTYLVRVVQGAGRSERILAEGRFQLE